MKKYFVEPENLCHIQEVEVLHSFQDVVWGEDNLMHLVTDGFSYRVVYAGDLADTWDDATIIRREKINAEIYMLDVAVRSELYTFADFDEIKHGRSGLTGETELELLTQPFKISEEYKKKLGD